MRRIVYDIKDVAEILQISSNSCYTLFHRKDFPSLKIGNKLYVRIDHFHEWLDAQKKRTESHF